MQEKHARFIDFYLTAALATTTTAAASSSSTATHHHHHRHSPPPRVQSCQYECTCHIYERVPTHYVVQFSVAIKFVVQVSRS
jgi:hypothetical protein